MESHVVLSRERGRCGDWGCNMYESETVAYHVRTVVSYRRKGHTGASRFSGRSPCQPRGPGCQNCFKPSWPSGCHTTCKPPQWMRTISNRKPSIQSQGAFQTYHRPRNREHCLVQLVDCVKLARAVVMLPYEHTEFVI